MALSLGIDFGGTSIKLGLCHGPEVVERFEPIDTRGYDQADPLIEALAGRILALKATRPELAGVGVGVPGFVEPRTGEVVRLTNVRGWVRVPLREKLAAMTGLPAAVLNDANAMALAEWQHGAGRGCANLACLTLGTGVGGGLIVNGQLVTGAAGGAAEIGQMSIDYQGRTGVYGNRGCVEKYVGNEQLAEAAQRLYREAGQSRSLEELAPKELARLADGGDHIARRVWRDAAGQLACVIANVCWLLNPERIVIGGGVAAAGELLLAPLRAELEDQLAELHWNSTELVPARFGNDAGLIGAAAAALGAL